MSARADPRGREATAPSEIPRRGWWDIASRVREQLGEDNASLLAAGVGLFALLAAFPALAALVSLYAIFPAPGEIGDQLESLSGVMPGAALDVLREQLTSIASTTDTTLGVGAAVGFVIALWGARKGMAALMQACNVAYDETRNRGMVRQILVSLAFTLGAIVYFVLTSAIAVGLPLVLEAWLGGGWLTQVLAALRWVLLWFFVAFALAVIYRYAPVRRRARWRWVTWGSATAATLWVVASIAFEVYVRTFGSFAETYGAIGGVVVLLLWLYLSGFVVILGAEINSETEHQTARDSTVGIDRPMGRRGAYVADTLGRARGEAAAK